MQDNSDIKNIQSFDTYSRIVTWLFLMTFLVAIIGVLVSIYFMGPTVLTVVAIAGSLGSFISVLIRLNPLREISDDVMKSPILRLQRVHQLIHALVPPLVGAIGAVIVFVIFAAQIIIGPAFPEFVCGEGVCDSFQDFVANWRPKEAWD